MGDKTEIAWTDATWNPVRGCSRVSPGCEHCYAEGVAARFSGPGLPYEGFATRKLHVLQDGTERLEPRWTGNVELVPNALHMPLRWRKPRRIFVNSMSDLFHEELDDDSIDQVYAMMLICSLYDGKPRHTFQVLTKRAERMAAYMNDPKTLGRVASAAGRLMEDSDGWHDFVFYNQPGLVSPHIQLGVSVEDQKRADERIPLLLATPAAVRFVSAEPLLGPVELSRWMRPTHWVWDARYGNPEEAIAAGAFAERRPQALAMAGTPRLSWVIVGGESGPRARPFDLAWAHSIVEQCKASGTACFVKQLGTHPVISSDGESWPISILYERSTGKGTDPLEWPEDLRVRQWPKTEGGTP